MDEHRLTTSGPDPSGRYRFLCGSSSRGRGCRIRRQPAVWLVMLILPLAGSGCATFHDNHFYAGELPAGYEAPPNTSPLTIDFSQLSGTSTASDVIGKGDVLSVNIAASMSSRDQLTNVVRVGDDGNAELPLIGPVRLAGLSLADADAVLTQVCVQRGLYRAPKVNVTMRKRKTNRILVLGAVKEPGVKDIPAGESDLLSILFHAGGLSSDAGTNVEIKNVLTRDEAMHEAIASGGSPSSGIAQTGYSTDLANPRSVKIDLISAAQSGNNDYYVGDRGVVMVEKIDPKALFVTGLVRKPGRVEFPQGEDLRLIDAISLAGYTSSQVATKVFVIRQPGPDAQPYVIQASLSKAKHDPRHNLRLAPGDIVSVEHTPATIAMEAFNMIRVGVSGSLNPLF